MLAIQTTALTRRFRRVVAVRGWAWPQSPFRCSFSARETTASGAMNVPNTATASQAFEFWSMP